MNEIIKIPNLKVEMIAVSLIKKYKQNPKRHPKDQVEIIRKSILEFGFRNPILLNNFQNKEIVAGHGRLQAAKELGMKEVPCISAEDLTENQVKAFRIMDNKSTESDWYIKQLGEEFKELDALDFDLDLTGFNFEEIRRILKSTEEAEEDDFDIKKAKFNPKYKIEQGDMWQLGDHRIICGDATSKEVIDKLVGDNKINLIFTSPPYNMEGEMYKEYKDNLGSTEFINFNLEVIRNLRTYLQGYIFWNISYNKKSRQEFIEILYKIIKEADLKFLELIVWNKKSALPITAQGQLTRKYEDILVVGTEEEISEDLELFTIATNERTAYFNKKTNRGLSNYWEIRPHGIQSEENKACFPVELPAKGIRLMTSVGDIVVDPFGGSGTSIIAAEQMKRKCYMIELHPIMCSVAIERWEQYTGEKATKLSGN